MAEKIVWIKCQFSRGGFPSERVFHIRTLGGEYQGIAPRRYCYGMDMAHCLPEPARGQKIDGFLPGIKLSEAGNIVRVHLPDGENYLIGGSQVVEDAS